MSIKSETVCDECGKQKPVATKTPTGKTREFLAEPPLDLWRQFTKHHPEYDILHFCSPVCIRNGLSKLGADPEIMRVDGLKNAPDLAEELAKALATVAELRAKLHAARPIMPQDVRDAAVDIFREVKDFLEHLTEQASVHRTPPPTITRSLFAKVVQMTGDALNR